MPASTSRSAQIRAKLDHPVIDSDGHTLEFRPALLDFVKAQGGPKLVERFEALRADAWYRMSEAERARTRTIRPAWWGVPWKNTLDRATAALPALLHSRLDEMGIDFAVLYPTASLGFPHLADEDLRRALCRAVNTYHAEIYREFSDRMAPVALIPMHTPKEAIAELEHAVGHLGLKAVMMASYVMRPHADGKGQWYDTLCLDSAYDYDPVWAKCIELKVSPTFHSNTKGVASRSSISSYTFNHIGHFAASGEALCKAAFLGGVTRRFPSLRMAFLEGGVGWGCSLYSDLVGHWKKRNRHTIQDLNPDNLDRERFWQLHRQYGGKLMAGRPDDQATRDLALYIGTGNPIGPTVEDPAMLDEFARCGIDSLEDVRERFVPNFYFGCEADDPINAWAFDARKNPLGARLRAIFSSDIGHWDVPDMRDVTAEAFELVEDGHISEADFRDFVFGNPLALWTGTNPEFFKGTVVEAYCGST